MKNKYNAVMEHIEVTSEMRERILRNIGKEDIAAKQRKAASFARYRKYYAVAACLVIVLAGAFVIHGFVDLGRPPIQVVPDIAEYGSIDELSAALGFTVREVGACPFEVRQIQYIAYRGKLAHIVYTGDSNSLVFRMSAGSEDLSGDYNDYPDVKKCPAGDFNVTIKGDQGQYTLALWEYDGYSYSIGMTEGIPEAEMLEAVQSVQ